MYACNHAAIRHTFFMQVGKQFDALLVDTQAPDASNPVFFTFPQDSMAVSLPVDNYGYSGTLKSVRTFYFGLMCHGKAVGWPNNKKWVKYVNQDI